MNAIEISGATIAISGRTILADVDLAIKENEFIGVLGPNGAGKTTLMRAMLGLVAVLRGRLEILGCQVTRGNPAIGYLPQHRDAAVTSRLRGRDVVASGAGGHRWGLPRLDDAAKRDVARVLELVGAEALAERPFAELSGGERQRLLLAQALLGQPRILLLDEPLISLDPHHQRGVVELVRRMQRALGLTVLFTAHELNPLLGAIDRVLYLGGGHAALGAVEEVVTPVVLSRLYGSAIDVVHLNGRIFVMSGDHDVEHDAHRHDGHEHA